MKKRVLIGDKVFPTKKAATEFFKEIKDGWDLEQPITGDDGRYVKDLLEYHPYFTEKVGPGIEYFFVGYNLFRSRCFYVKRIDGTHIDFSYKKCLDEAAMP